MKHTTLAREDHKVEMTTEDIEEAIRKLAGAPPGAEVAFDGRHLEATVSWGQESS